MKNLKDNMNEILGIEGDLIVDEKRPVVIPKSVDKKQDIQSDYEYARSNLYGVIETSSEALSQLVELAKASEHPRAFEVVGQLTKTLVDANKDLLEIQKKVKALQAEDEQVDDSGKNVTNNNLYVGSTSDLLKMIKDEDSSDALNQLVELAKASEHPRAFEVVGQLTKTLLDANKDLLEIQKKVKALQAEEDQQVDESGKQVTNNNLFVGSTSDLLKMIKDEDRSD
jgi:hypothetical protein